MTDKPTKPPENQMSEENQGLVADFLTFLKEEKIWWILPLVILLLLFALIIILGQSAGPLAPFIYPFA